MVAVAVLHARCSHSSPPPRRNATVLELSLFAPAPRRCHEGEMRRCWTLSLLLATLSSPSSPPRRRNATVLELSLLLATLSSLAPAPRRRHEGEMRRCWTLSLLLATPSSLAPAPRRCHEGEMRQCWSSRCCVLVVIVSQTDARPPTRQLNIVRAQRAGSRARAAVRRVAGKLVGGRRRAR